MPQRPFIDAPVDILSVHFTGRTEELLRIKEILDLARGDAPIRCVVHGMPGVGKSQLTLYFAKSAFDQGHYQYVLWISATTVQKFQQGFVKLLYLIDHKDRDHTQQDVRLIAARRWLEECQEKWLLVLDNVALDTLGFLQQNLPRQNNRGNILFTTRTESLANSLASSAGQKHQILELRSLDLGAAAELLLHHVDGDMDDEQISKAKDVAKSVGCLPLAVSQAGSFMRETSTDLESMLNLYKSEHKMEIISWENALSNYETKSVAATFSSQLEELARRSSNASNLLKILSFLDPESISLDMISQGAETVPVDSSVFHRFKNKLSGVPDLKSMLAFIRSPVDLPIAITQLQRQSLVKRQNTAIASTLYIHDLVQFMVQENVNKGGGGKPWFGFAVQLISGAFARIADPSMPQYWPQCEMFMSHIRSLTNRQETHGNRETWVALMGDNERISDYLAARGRYAENEELLGKVLASREQVLGSDHMNTWQTKHRIALLYQYQGRHIEAEMLYAAILVVWEKRLGVEHADTLATMNNLANSYRYQGRYVDAEKMYQRILTVCEKRFGPEHHLTLGTMNNLANLYRSQGHADRAAEMHRRILAIREKLDGPEHPETLKSLNNLANACNALGKHAEAEEMLQRVLTARQKHLGVEHPDTISTMGNLAYVYHHQGRYNEAEEMHKRVLVAQEKLLTVEHPHTLLTMNNLVFLYQSQGRLGEAEVMQKRILIIQEKFLGIGHRLTLMTMNDLVVLYVSLGRLDDAADMQGRIVAAREKVLGVDHVDTLSSVNDLGVVYESQHRYSDAEEMYKRALAGREKDLPIGDPDTLATMQCLVRVYRAQGRVDEAETLSRRAASLSPATTDNTNS